MSGRAADRGFRQLPQGGLGQFVQRQLFQRLVGRGTEFVDQHFGRLQRPRLLDDPPDFGHVSVVQFRAAKLRLDKFRFSG